MHLVMGTERPPEDLVSAGWIKDSEKYGPHFPDEIQKANTFFFFGPFLMSESYRPCQGQRKYL